MPKKEILVIIFVSLLFLISGSQFVFAQGLCEPCPKGVCDPGLDCVRGKCRGCPQDGVVVICNPLQACDIQELIDIIINFIFYVALAIVPLMVLIGAFYILTAAGDPKRVETGKKIILYTVIGFAIILFARGLIAAIRHFFGGK